MIKREGRTIAFLPYQFASRTHRLLGFGQRVGGELNDSFGLVAAADCELSPLRLLRLAGLNALLFTHLDQGQARFGLAGSQPQPGLRIDLSLGSAVYWEALKRRDKRFVADTERRERKLIEAHGPLRLSFHHDNSDAELTRLIARKREQYARTGVADSLADAKTRQFLRRLVKSDDPLCRGVMSTLHAGSTWVASHFGLMHHGTLHFWFPVYNPDLQPFSPGRILVASLIGQADALGIRCIDRGVGDSQAKRDFANAEHTFTRGLWHRHTVSAGLIRAGLSLRWRLDGMGA
ncbi:MAG: GNAT family N-acetyltransferase [Alphaproteobacteria bacterium]|nr:GNAT family N-acetyltransferase [Alphaproteobacteria bacterium]